MLFHSLLSKTVLVYLYSHHEFPLEQHVLTHMQLISIVVAHIYTPNNIYTKYTQKFIVYYNIVTCMNAFWDKTHSSLQLLHIKGIRILSHMIMNACALWDTCTVHSNRSDFQSFQLFVSENCISTSAMRVSTCAVDTSPNGRLPSFFVASDTARHHHCAVAWGPHK